MTGAALLLVAICAGAPRSAEAPLLRWDAGARDVVCTCGGTEAFRLRGLGPRRQDGSAGKLSWTAMARAAGQGEMAVEMASDDPAAASASPGRLDQPGPWIGLDLSQYSLAHGQPFWPKTYYLGGLGLFVCCWWDLAASNSSGFSWPDAEADSRRGTGPVVPAATMVYTAGPDGTHAPLREVLHVRVARRLWDAALPSLCRPSEYRHELASMVYLDIWSGDRARDLTYTLGVLGRLAGRDVRFLSILQNWEAGGFDVLLPDSIWMPDHPPSPAVGTVEDLRRLCEAGKAVGRFGFRTNYSVLRTRAPSFIRGLVGFALGPDGKPAWFTQPSRWAALARRQEAEIARLFRPNAAFTDQLGSGGSSAAYLDFGRAAGGDGTMATALRHQRGLARLIKTAHRGPLGTETVNQQDLVGCYCDFADFGIMGGHDRLFPLDYKLRRIHDLTVSYGCGLFYRFFELPPFPRFHAAQLDLWSDPSPMDDYRCVEVLLGNGGYLFWPCPWPYALSEVFVVGRLQQRYALKPVLGVEYLVGGTWRSLEEMVVGGFAPQTRPWNQSQAELGRVRVRCAGGLTVIGNRLADEMEVATPRGPVALPRYGWVAFTADGRFLAFSAYWPGTQLRADYLDDRDAGLRFLNPRGARIEGGNAIRLWRGGKLAWWADAAGREAHTGGARLPLNPPAPARLTDIAADFRGGLGHWRPIAGILRVEPADDGARLTICGEDPQIIAPLLALDGRPGDALEVTLSADAGTLGQLYFSTAAEAMSERQVLQFPVVPDGKLHTATIPVGSHPRWPGARITEIRLDPTHGSSSSTVVLRSVRLVRQGGG